MLEHLAKSLGHFRNATFGICIAVDSGDVCFSPQADVGLWAASAGCLLGRLLNVQHGVAHWTGQIGERGAMPAKVEWWEMT